MINIIIFIELGEWDVLTGGLGRTMRGGGCFQKLGEIVVGLELWKYYIYLFNFAK
jgi:hypothetical protein